MTVSLTTAPGPDAQAVLLLCAHFSKRGADETKPLSPGEYNAVAGWLNSQGKRPRDLLSEGRGELLQSYQQSAVDAVRITALLRRGPALALALEKWSQRGVWTLSRADPEYPPRLKARLNKTAPPLLFGVGPKELLQREKAVAIVGSRNADEAGLTFARQVARRCAREGIQVVSGGARGVDTEAMEAALGNDGAAVGVLAEQLSKAAVKKTWREYLEAEQLVLVSAFDPDARFTVANAMSRNKLIYALSDFAVVAHSDVKGGTWSGATENLRRGWVPLLVRVAGDGSDASQGLINRGAQPLTDEALSSSESMAGLPEKRPTLLGEALYDAVEQGRESVPEAVQAPPPVSDETPLETEKLGDHLYRVFLSGLADLLRAGDLSEEELVKASGLAKPQLRPWLKRAVADGHLAKTKRPVRYRANTSLPFTNSEPGEGVKSWPDT